MNINNIKYFALTLATIVGVFASAGFVSAQNVIGSCTTATLNGTVITHGNTTNAWFEMSASQSRVDSGTASRTPTQTFASDSSMSQFVDGLTANTTYYYRIVVSNSVGTSNGATVSFTTASCGGGYVNPTYTLPSVSTYSANNVSANSADFSGYVNTNGSSDTYRWFEWGSTSYTGGFTQTQQYSQGGSSGTFSASVYNLAPNTVYYFRAAARNSQGTVYGNVVSFTTSGQYYNNYNNVIYNNNTVGVPVVTISADQTVVRYGGDTTIRLSVVNASSCVATGGSNGWAGTRNTGVSSFLTGALTSSTVYTITCTNANGSTTNSATVSVQNPTTTVTTVVPTNTVRNVTTVVTRAIGTQSLISLSIDGGTEALSAGEKRTYKITWTNDSAQTLSNVVLRVVFPQSMTFDSTTTGAFSATDNTVTVDLKSLNAGETGTMSVTGVAYNSLKSGELVVVTANIVYTDTKGLQGSTTAYITHRGAGGAVLGASIFGAGSFLPTTLVGWLLLFILVLAIVLLVDYYYGRRRERTESWTKTETSGPVAK
ncbi:MAG: hypothetical protein PHS95_00915 [Candidatus Pacebacteria bacterium]|nr:hypothetical protein [Candidatus Paceibacterota bacterium]